MVRRGVYIAVEGIDGAGKTLISGMLTRELDRRNYRSLYVREPWLPKIKEFLYADSLDPEVESMVFAVDRMVLQSLVVKPALERGVVVVSDRTVFSSLAYQYVRGVPEEKILFFNRKVVFPDLVFLLDLDVDTALARIRDRRKNRFELKHFLRKVRARYLELSKKHGFIVVDASRSPEEVLEEVLSETLRLLDKK